MSGFLLTLHDAGRAALVNAAHTGTAERLITEIGLASAPFVPHKQSPVLAHEFKRLRTLDGNLSGAVVAADMIHAIVRDASAEQYTFYGFGLFLDSGELLASYSQREEDGPIMEKSPQAMLLLAIDGVIDSIDTARLAFGDTNFLNPPATTDTEGVVALATLEQTRAGQHTQRAVTPAGLQATLGPALATKADANHRHAIVEVDGLQSALDAKLNLSGGTVKGNVILSNSTLALQNGNYTASMRADPTGFVGFLNQDLSAWNLQLSEAGVLSLPRGRPNWAGGLIPWDTGNFNPNTRVAKTGDRMSGDLYVDSGAVRVSGWGGNTNAGIAFLNAASTRYLQYDGASYIMPGADLYTGPNASRVWHAGNFNPAAYQPAGNYQPAGSYQAAGDYLRNHANQSTAGLYINSSSPPNIAAITPSGNNDNVALTIGTDGNLSASAVIQFHRQGSFAAYFGLDNDNQWAVGGRSMGNVRYRLWHEGNFTPASYAPVRNFSNRNSGYVGSDTGQSIVVNWDGNFRIYVDGTIGSALWGTHNFDPNHAVALANNANANAEGRVPKRQAIQGDGYVLTGSNAITIGWNGSYNLYTDNQYQGDIVHSNNWSNWAAPRSAMDYGGVGSYTFMNTGANPGINTLVNLPGMGGTWRVMSGAFGANGKDILYVRIG